MFERIATKNHRATSALQKSISTVQMVDSGMQEGGWQSGILQSQSHLGRLPSALDSEVHRTSEGTGLCLKLRLNKTQAWDPALKAPSTVIRAFRCHYPEGQIRAHLQRGALVSRAAGFHSAMREPTCCPPPTPSCHGVVGTTLWPHCCNLKSQLMLSNCHPAALSQKQVAEADPPPAVVTNTHSTAAYTLFSIIHLIES